MTPASAPKNQEYSIHPRLYIGFELSATNWRLASSDGSGAIREKSIEAGDRQALVNELKAAKKRFKLPDDVEVRTCYEAGRDGFWVHRLLEEMDLSNIVIDAASMKVNRKARRAKSDGIDARELLAQLIRYYSGDRGVWSVVRVPSPEVEDGRRLHRELERLKKEKTQHQVRIKALLATQGFKKDDIKHVLANLDEARTPLDTRLLPGLKQEIEREVRRLDVVQDQVREILKQRRDILKTCESSPVKKVEALSALSAIGEDSAWLLVMEFFGWREFRNRRQVGACAGLVGTPYSSGSSHREQGISKAGNPRVRTRMIEVAWFWLRYQPSSKLSQWFNERFANGGKRMRRVGIVAMARRLLIDLWRLAEFGVIPEGAKLKAG